jgi:membrane protein implicated in regulation of membrane protease activity
MSGGQIAALIVAIILLLPGGCFLIMGLAFLGEHDRIARDVAPLALIMAAILLAITGLLFWVAFRRRRGGPGEPPPPSQTAA